jgi:hypothetical protein
MKNILISFFLLLLSITILDIFLPIDFYAYRHWEKFYSPILLPGPFIPNKTTEGYEYTDRYLSRSNYERKAAKRIYTRWQTDDLGFRNDKLKSTIYNSEVIFVGDSNFVGSSFDQEEIVSELFMSQANNKAYTVAYNLRYILTLIENNKLHNIKHLVLESKPSYFNGEYKELTPFYINTKCEIFAIHYPHLINMSNFKLFDFYQYNYKNRPFSKFIRSKLGIYNFPESFKAKNLETLNKKNNNCNNLDEIQDITIKYDQIDYDKNHIKLESIADKNLFFKNLMLYLHKYFGDKNIKFTMLLLTDHNTDEVFKMTTKELNLNGKFIYDSNDLMINGDIWQAGDSHWKVEAARNFINIIKNQ